MNISDQSLQDARDATNAMIAKLDSQKKPLCLVAALMRILDIGLNSDIITEFKPLIRVRDYDGEDRRGAERAH